MSQENLQTQPHAKRSEFSMSIKEVQSIAHYVDETKPRRISAAVIERGAKAVLMSFSIYQKFLSEHSLYCFIMAKKKIGVNNSFARCAQLATFQLENVMNHSDSFVLAGAVQLIAEEFPDTKFALLPDSYRCPTDFVSEGFYFSLGPSFLASTEVNRQSIVQVDHYFHMQCTLNMLQTQIPVPGCCYDSVIFPAVRNLRYHLFNYDGKKQVSLVQDASGPITFFQNNNKVTKKYYKNRARIQEQWQDGGSKHPFFYHPTLNTEQKEQKIFLDPPQEEGKPKPENLIRRIQSPQDKYQMLDMRFRFGIGEWQMQVQPTATHPEFVEREKQLAQKQAELLEKNSSPQAIQQYTESQLKVELMKRRISEITANNRDMEKRLKGDTRDTSHPLEKHLAN